MLNNARASGALVFLAIVAAAIGGAMIPTITAQDQAQTVDLRTTVLRLAQATQPSAIDGVEFSITAAEAAVLPGEHASFVVTLVNTTDEWRTVSGSIRFSSTSGSPGARNRPLPLIVSTEPFEVVVPAGETVEHEVGSTFSVSPADVPESVDALRALLQRRSAVQTTGSATLLIDAAEADASAAGEADASTVTETATEGVTEVEVEAEVEADAEADAQQADARVRVINGVTLIPAVEAQRVIRLEPLARAGASDEERERLMRLVVRLSQELSQNQSVVRISGASNTASAQVSIVTDTSVVGIAPATWRGLGQDDSTEALVALLDRMQAVQDAVVAVTETTTADIVSVEVGEVAEAVTAAVEAAEAVLAEVAEAVVEEERAD